MDVQKVDFKDLNAPDKFTTSLHQTGFSVLTNHPVDIDLIKSVYSDWKSFFNDSKKDEYIFDPLKQDGYFPFKTENAKDSSLKDLKEFFHFYPWGKYPKDLGNATLTLYNQLLKLTSILLGWIQNQTPKNVKSLFSTPLPEMINGGNRNLLRIIHYPPLNGNEEKGEIRGSPHEDINLITLLVAGTQPGLQVKDNKGIWHDISCNLGHLAINVGDMLQEASGGYYPSTTHQVVNPGNNIKNESRFSMPLFLHPRDDIILSKKYTAKAYLNERLKEIGLK